METSEPASRFDGSNRVDDGALSISIDDLHVRYRVPVEQHLSTPSPLQRVVRVRQMSEVHAIRGVTFHVGVGEAVGVLGSNGSGKSTLLRAIAGLQPAHAGRARVRGAPRLLGVNAALKPELSGYRNVFLGGLAMGLRPSEIEAALPDLIEFSELDDALARPLRTYSSGMRSRLAFTIATLTVPDILLIDEALAVGDRRFKERSLERIREIRRQAQAVMMVSHNLNEIRSTCSRAIWLDQGAVRMDGPAGDVIEAYESELN